MLYFDFARSFEQMNLEDLGGLFLAILHYGEFGQDDNPKGTGFLWEYIKNKIDDDTEAYAERLRKSEYGGYKAQAEKKGETFLSYQEWLAQNYPEL